MELKEGYKQTEVGVIPEDWDIEFIENLAHITTGSRNTQDRVDDGQYPFYVRSQVVERINSYSFDGEAVLTAGDGVGTGKVFHYINGKFDAHQRVYRISEFNERIEGYFFYLYFSSHFYNRIMQMTAKSSVDSVRREMIAKMVIPLPPTKAEQEAITTALSDVDILNAALDRLIVKKRDIKQAAMQELFTVVPSGNWKTKKIRDECDLISKGTTPTTLGKDFVDHGINFIKVESINEDGNIDESRLAFIDEETYNLLKRSQLKSNDILFSIAGALGRVAIVDEEVLPANINQALSFIRLREQSEINHLYLFHYLKSHRIKNFINAINVQAAQANLSLENVRDFEIAYPPFPEQCAIAASLSDMDNEIAALEARRNKIHSIKQGMMQELLTGRIRLVKGDEA